MRNMDRDAAMSDYKWVPVEPTEEMLQAGLDAYIESLAITELTFLLGERGKEVYELRAKLRDAYAPKDGDLPTDSADKSA